MKFLFKYSNLFIFSLLCTGAFAQGTIRFAKVQHSFGTIQEENGPVKVEFEFTNTGNAPLKVLEVRPSCGCTTPTWTKEAIEPGKTGIITASYDPTNRPGKFDKTINVNTDGNPAQMILTINGEVIPRQRTYKDFYPIEIGNLRMTTKNVYINQVYHDGTASEKLVLYNQGTKPINIKVAETNATLPKHITVKFPKTTILPKDSIKVDISFDATKQNDWGYTNAQFMLNTDDEAQPMKQFFVGANVIENFGNLTNDTKLPMLSYDKQRHNFGKINQNTQNTVSFNITNKGNAPLIIRKTKASCGCTVGQPKKMQLAPNETTSIEVTFSSAGKQGKQTQTVTVITNDPAQPQTLLSIEAEVLSPNTPQSNPKGGK